MLHPEEPLAFKYNVDSHRIESDQPDVYLEICGIAREAGHKLLLKFGYKSIGFMTFGYGEVSQSFNMEDGTKCWRIGAICCDLEIGRGSYPEMSIEYVPAYMFSSIAEQELVLSTFLAAMSAWDGCVEPQKLPARSDFTDQVKEEIEKGRYLKPKD